ncbi:MAG: pyridoxamine 5'-phosphate oxidase family protein [Synergistaceae bacterium]|jgi:uncharacterized pyridoxamine 5'-phosphate oxidase family protein|nr:pyridoxamine 5'-phosphate oxidase family protein [Synergistaceae bacterium]
MGMLFWVVFVFMFFVPLTFAATRAAADDGGAADMDKLRDFIKECGIYHLATVEDDQPRVRPFGTFTVYDGSFYIQSGRVKNVSKQIFANSKIELSAYDGRNKWVRIQAVATEDPRRKVKEFMLDTYPDLKKIYSADDDNTLVLRLSDVTARLCSFESGEKIIKFPNIAR